MGIKLDKLNVKVDVLLDNGVYIFNNMSSTGKTYLYNTISMYLGDKDINVFGLTYTEYQKGLTLDKALKDKAKLVVVDRYDMYKGEFDAEIEELGKTGIVLVDCKSPTELKAYHCTIKLLDSTHIVVR